MWTLWLVILFGMAGLIVPQTSIAMPNTGRTQKTRRRDHCTDAYLIYLPLRSGQPGSMFGGVRPPGLPGQNATIMRRGVEGEQADLSPTEQEEKPTVSK